MSPKYSALCAQLVRLEVGAPTRCCGIHHLGAIDAVCELEEVRQPEADEPRDAHVEEQHAPPREEQHRDHQGPRDVECLPERDHRHITSTQPRRQLVAGLAAGDDRGEIRQDEPLDRQEAVEHPHVDVLVLVPDVPPLLRGEASERRLVDVGVVSDHVRVAVVQAVVLEPPEERAGAEQVGGVSHHPVHLLRCAERTVVGVMHDARRHAHAGHDEHQRAPHSKHEAERREHKAVVARRPDRDDENGLALQTTTGTRDLDRGRHHRRAQARHRRRRDNDHDRTSDFRSALRPRVM